jgi:HPt (histidine-containing phosphotransfer) domain-containing protein
MTETQSASTVPSPSTFDYVAAVQSMDAETIEILTPVFLEQYGSDIEHLRQALAAGDAALIQRHAHSLKGTLAAFGARPGEQLAAEIEARARAGELVGADRLAPLVAVIEALAAVLRS